MSLSVLTMSRKRQARIAIFAGLCLVFAGSTLAGAQMLPEVVATVQDQPITSEELTASIRGELLKLDMQRYQVLKNGLDDMIGQRLTEMEAKNRNISIEALRQEEITAKITQATDADIQKFYEDNKDRIKQPFEQIKGRIQEYLNQRSQQQREQAFMRELRQRYNVAIALEAPKVDVSTDNDPVRGTKDALVTIIEFSDFECPYCRRVQPALKRLLEEYDGRVRLVFRDFPLSIHKNAQKAAEAAQCAAEQDKYWVYHDKLFEQTALAPSDLKKYAGELELDVDKFTTCLDTGKYTQEVADDMKDGQAAGVNSTPSFFINGQPLSGAVPYERFQELVDAALDQHQSAKQN
jgi:protein-disulfide isomerase